jgi:L-fuculose-phosphate aldolase
MDETNLKEIQNEEIVLKPIGFIRSPITDHDKAPCMGSEESITGRLIVAERYADAFLGLQPGQQIVILYWMHLAERDMLQVHPRRDHSRPVRGVFSTRSPQRPNPIAVDTVEIIEIQGTVITVRGLDAMDGTPLLDIKCVI